MRVIGSRISSTAMEQRYGLMEHAMKDNMYTVKKKAWAASSGPTNPPSRVNSKITTSTGTVSTSGRTDDATMASGSTTKWKERASLLGQTVASMSASIRKTRNMDRESSFGRMGGNILEAGLMGSSMGKACM